MKKASSVLLSLVLAFGVGLSASASKTTGSCQSSATTLSPGTTKLVTFQNEWDEDWGENTDFAVHWFKISLTLGKDCTIWTEGATEDEYFGIWVNPKDAEEMPSVDYIDSMMQDGCNVRVYFTKKGDVRYAIDFRGDGKPFAVKGAGEGEGSRDPGQPRGEICPSA